MKWHEDVALVNKIVDENVLNKDYSQCKVELNACSIFHKVASLPKEKFVSILGSNSSGFYDFCAAVKDSKHPELAKINQGIFNDSHSFSEVMSELVCFVDLVGSAGFVKLLSHIKSLSNSALPVNFTALNQLDDPRVSLKSIRFLSNNADIETTREKMSSAHSVSIQETLKSNKDVWGSLEDCFSSLAINQTPFKTDEEYLRSIDSFENAGAFLLAQKQRDLLKSKSEYKDSQYYGFTRIGVVPAAITLAKVIGCEFGLGKFKHYHVNMPIALNQEVHSLFPVESRVSVQSKNFNIYEARAYPINMLLDVLPERTKKLINLLDNFPLIGNQALFDYYIGMIPSGVVDNSAHIKHSIDSLLLKNKIVPSILIGVIETNTYFIDYIN